MRKLLALFSLAAVFFIIAILLLALEVNKVCFETRCFDVELAATSIEQTRGLSNRTTLPENNGMLFVFPSEGVYRFWMKDMLFPLDIVWIAQNGTVVHIEKNAPPCSEACPYLGSAAAKFVLEVNTGELPSNIVIGTVVQLPYNFK